jgi:hypothetical protein
MLAACWRADKYRAALDGPRAVIDDCDLFERMRARGDVFRAAVLEYNAIRAMNGPADPRSLMNRVV